MSTRSRSKASTRGRGGASANHGGLPEMAPGKTSKVHQPPAKKSKPSTKASPVIQVASKRHQSPSLDAGLVLHGLEAGVVVKDGASLMGEEEPQQIIVEEPGLDSSGLGELGDQHSFRIEMPQMELRGDPMVASTTEDEVEEGSHPQHPRGQHDPHRAIENGLLKLEPVHPSELPPGLRVAPPKFPDKPLALVSTDPSSQVSPSDSPTEEGSLTIALSNDNPEGGVAGVANGNGVMGPSDVPEVTDTVLQHHHQGEVLGSMVGIKEELTINTHASASPHLAEGDLIMGGDSMIVSSSGPPASVMSMVDSSVSHLTATSSPATILSGNSNPATQEINLNDISYVTMDDNGDTVIIVNTDQVLIDQARFDSQMVPQSAASQLTTIVEPSVVESGGYSLPSDASLLGSHFLTSTPPANLLSPSAALSGQLTPAVIPSKQLPTHPLLSASQPAPPPPQPVQLQQQQQQVVISNPPPQAEVGGRPDYAALKVGDKIYICVISECPYFCHWQGDMIVHLISAHAAQLPVEKILPVALDSAEQGEGQCSCCRSPCFRVTTIGYFDSATRKMTRVRKVYRQCKLCPFSTTGTIFNHIPLCHNAPAPVVAQQVTPAVSQGQVIVSSPNTFTLTSPNGLVSPISSRQVVYSPTVKQQVLSTSTPKTISLTPQPQRAQVINLTNNGVAYSQAAQSSRVNIKQEPVGSSPRKIMEVVNSPAQPERPTYRLPFIDLVSSVKSGKLETPSERNKRKKKKVSNPIPTTSAAEPQSAKVQPGAKPAAASEDTGASFLKKPPNLHITRQTVANFVCSTCGKVQKDNLALKHHMEVDHRNDQRFKCSKCVFQTDDTNEWNEHYLDCTIQPDYKMEGRIKGEVVDSDEG